MELDAVKQFIEEKLGEGLREPQLFGRKIAEIGQYLIANHEQMSADAQAHADNFLNKLAESLASMTAALPDGKGKRTFRRTTAQAQRKHHSIQQLAGHLVDFPINDAPVITESEPTLYGVLQSVLDVLFDATREESPGIPTMPLLALHYWCIDELLTSYHLARHHFATQAYAHIRLTYEHLDLIDLFQKQPRWIEVWAGGDAKKIIRELSPKGIRAKLGHKKFDPIYSKFTEMGAHGSFVGLQARTAVLRTSVDGTPEIKMWVGGVPRQEQIVLAILWVLLTSVSVLGSAAACFEDRLLPEEAWDMLRIATENVITWSNEHFVPWASCNGFEVDGLLSIINKVPDILGFYKKP